MNGSLRWNNKIPAKSGAVWNELHSLEILSVTSRLRTHAQRALHEAGYKTNSGETRREFAANLRAMAKRIDDRRKLRLNTKWWIDLASDVLENCDRRNPP